MKELQKQIFELQIQLDLLTKTQKKYNVSSKKTINELRKNVKRLNNRIEILEY